MEKVGRIQVGRKYDHWTVLRIATEDEVRSYVSKKVRWFCRCDCGVERIVDHNSLLTGGTQSCGCLRKKRFTETLRRENYLARLRRLGR